MERQRYGHTWTRDVRSTRSRPDQVTYVDLPAAHQLPMATVHAACSRPCTRLVAGAAGSWGGWLRRRRVRGVRAVWRRSCSGVTSSGACARSTAHGRLDTRAGLDHGRGSITSRWQRADGSEPMAASGRKQAWLCGLTSPWKRGACDRGVAPCVRAVRRVARGAAPSSRPDGPMDRWTDP